MHFPQLLFLKCGMNTREGESIIRHRAIIISSFLLLLLGIHLVEASNVSLQKLIDEAEPDATIELPGEAFHETILIDKPLEIIGTTGTEIIHEGKDPAITILADGVTLKNVNVTYSTNERRRTAIYVEGDHNTIEHVDIDTNGYGIHLNDAHHNEISNVTITGEEKRAVAQRDHGILVWTSDHNTIHDSVFQHVQDGIYVEKSKGNHIYNNVAANLRYGYHLMFTQETVLEDNESFGNISGMMIMGTYGTIAKRNYLHHNLENIQSLGLLLYNVQDATIADNEIFYNRIGIFVEQAENNEITNNIVQGNYVGLQFLKANENDIHDNVFIANIAQGQAEASSENSTNRNYWDDHQGLDLNGDGTSDIVYEVDPFFLHITDVYPPLSLLFDSPGMMFLEQLIETPDEEKFIDDAPLMENPLPIQEETGNRSIAVLLFSFILLTISSTTIFMGVKRK